MSPKGIQDPKVALPLPSAHLTPYYQAGGSHDGHLNRTAGHVEDEPG